LAGYILRWYIHQKSHPSQCKLHLMWGNFVDLINNITTTLQHRLNQSLFSLHASTYTITSKTCLLLAASQNYQSVQFNHRIKSCALKSKTKSHILVTISYYHAILRGQHDSFFSISFKQRSTEAEACSVLVTYNRLQLSVISNKNNVLCTWRHNCHQALSFLAHATLVYDQLERNSTSSKDTSTHTQTHRGTHIPTQSRKSYRWQKSHHVSSEMLYRYFYLFIYLL